MIKTKEEGRRGRNRMTEERRRGRDRREERKGQNERRD